MTKCQICNLDQYELNFKLCMQHGFIICSNCANDIDNEGSNEL